MAIKMLLNKFQSKRKRVKIIYWRLPKVIAIMKFVNIKYINKMITCTNKIMSKNYQNKIIMRVFIKMKFKNRYFKTTPYNKLKM